MKKTSCVEDIRINVQEVFKINKAIIVYTIVDDVLKGIQHKGDERQQMTDAEVITTAILAGLLFGGNVENARKILFETGLIPRMLSKSRLWRRIHALKDLMADIFLYFGEVFKQFNESFEYIMDTFPVAVCDNIRIKRCRLVRSEEFRGYCASKRRYFYGVKVQIVSTSDGIPVEILFLPGSAHDSEALHLLNLDLPKGSNVYADAAYTNYDVEDTLIEQDGITLSPQRKKVSMRQDDFPTKLYKSFTRKKIETVFSQITQLFPRQIHAVTMKGFLLKILLFILGFTLDRAFGQIL